jgi:hypothetical protein
MSQTKASLTAKTLNNEVFPAFCSPIIVISISFDLKRDMGISECLAGLRLCQGLSFRSEVVWLEGGNLGCWIKRIIGTNLNILSSQSYSMRSIPAIVRKKGAGQCEDGATEKRMAACDGGHGG